jgi:hypothetical protein
VGSVVGDHGKGGYVGCDSDHGGGGRDRWSVALRHICPRAVWPSS